MPCAGSKQKEASPHTFSPLEAGATGSAEHPDPDSSSSGLSQPAVETALHGRTPAGSLYLPGHLSQAISEHLACATGGSGRPSSAADVSPQDHGPAGVSPDTSRDHSQSAAEHDSTHRNLHEHRDGAVHAPSHQGATPGSSQGDVSGLNDVAGESVRTAIAATPEENAPVSHLRAEQLGETSQVHQKPAMEGPSSKRLKTAESASEAATSSSELNPADFGLASVPVWQSTAEAAEESSSSHPSGKL